MDLLLGLDVGTTATKGLLLNIDGTVVASASYRYGLITPRENWVEQEPEELWNGVVAVCRSVLEHTGPKDCVLALSISSQAGTTIPVDDEGAPIGNAISWMDNRAHKQAKQIGQILGRKKLYKKTGWQLGDGLPMLHVSWLRQCAPEVFAAARRFLFVNDFIIYRLTGEFCMNPSDAGITQLYNVAKGRWDDKMMRMAGIDSDKLSPIKDSGIAIGQLTEKASEEIGLPQSTLVVNGAHDQYCAAVGAGVLKKGDVMLSCGTAWVVLCFMKRLKMDSGGRLSISAHAIPGRWGALKSLGGVGACMEWFIRNLYSNSADRSDLYSEVNRDAEKSPAGSKGLIFLPSSGGYGHGSRGGFIGLNLLHSQGDMARSVMEGIVYELRHTVERIEALSPKIWRMVGGAAASSIWPKIVADVTHIPVALPATTEAAASGAAILAGVGGGVFANPKAGYKALGGNETLIEPNIENGKKYDEMYQVYLDVVSQINSSLMKLSQLRDTE